jgi:hypothetical protein
MNGILYIMPHIMVLMMILMVWMTVREVVMSAQAEADVIRELHKRGDLSKEILARHEEVFADMGKLFEDVIKNGKHRHRWKYKQGIYAKEMIYLLKKAQKK